MGITDTADIAVRLISLIVDSCLNLFRQTTARHWAPTATRLKSTTVLLPCRTPRPLKRKKNSGRPPRPMQCPHHSIDGYLNPAPSQHKPAPLLKGENRIAHPSGHQPSGALPPTPPFPGRIVFGPGCANVWVLMVRLRLIAHGYADDQRCQLEDDTDLANARVWDDRLRRSFTEFQLDLGLRGREADGYPAEATWLRLWCH